MGRSGRQAVARTEVESAAPSEQLASGASKRAAAGGEAAWTVDRQDPARAGEPSGMGQTMMDLEFVRGLIEAVDRSGIDSLEIARAGTRIRIAKTPPQLVGAPAGLAMPAPQQAPVALAASAPPPVPAAAPAAVEPAAAEAPKSNLVGVKFPMVGTFYRAPAPEAPPYAEVGTHVTKGQTLCILEAMKLMNELESEVDGIVREVLVDNTEPVEYGQVLFRIEPSR
jgi:acetyl-CoA carboxylase biotin carboxyl carrier protein